MDMTKTTKPELKPCPFCGASTVNDTSPPTAGTHGQYYWVCPDCVAVGPFANSPNEATEKWNTRAPQWQPIETAPKDETLILISQDAPSPKFRAVFCAVFFQHSGWLSFPGHFDCKPTHWMPLPEAPEVE